jgi:hypothetical protein
VVQLEHPWALRVRRAVARHTPTWLDRVPVRRIFAYDAG